MRESSIDAAPERTACHLRRYDYIPAFAGMTTSVRQGWIPAFAGMTSMRQGVQRTVA